MEYGSCWLCGKNGVQEPLDTHHIFGGAYRKKSEKLGLKVRMCHNSCHIFGENAAHRNRETMQQLHEYGQKLAMEKFDWTVEDFRREFGKNYLDEDGAVRASLPTEESKEIEATEIVGFCSLKEVDLPY